MYCYVKIKAWVTFTIQVELGLIAVQSVMVISDSGVYFYNSSIHRFFKMNGIIYTMGLIIRSHHWLQG